jgi:hypothetical protein
MQTPGRPLAPQRSDFDETITLFHSNGLGPCKPRAVYYAPGARRVARRRADKTFSKIQRQCGNGPKNLRSQKGGREQCQFGTEH